MSRKRVFFILFFILIIVSFFLFFQIRSSAFLFIRNSAGEEVNISVSGDIYTISKSNSLSSIGFQFPLSGTAEIEILGLNNLSGLKVCKVTNKPFGVCAIEVFISKEQGVICSHCFPL